MYNSFSKALLGTAAALSFVASAAVAEEWRAWNIHSDGHPNTAAMDRFAELVADKTGGEVSVEVFHGGVLGTQPDAIEQVQLGAIDVGNFNLGPLGSIVNEANLVSLPFIFRDVDHMFRVMDGPAGEQVSAAMGEAGLLPIGWFDAGARSFYNNTGPINTPDDVAGMKIRVMNNDLFTGMVNAMGGNGTPMAFSEVYQSLSTGVVDGAENNLPSFQSVGHFEVAGFYSLSEHLIIPECICVNTAAFEGLSADMQAAVVAAAEEAAAYQRELWSEQTEASREAVTAAGVQINEIADKTPFQEAMVPVYEDYLAANPSMAELVELAQSTE
ncbi:TRAP transporter substrate-binding protein [Yoonia maricola]|nr:TRAP transporter substrate-binding protein [Yoonia maricola]